MSLPVHAPDPEKNGQQGRLRGRGYFCRCGLLCSTESNLEIHIKSFNSPRNFFCKICDERFVTASFLKAHMDAKHKIKLVTRRIVNHCVACGDCGEYFVSRQEHRRHREAYHNDKDSPTKEKKSETENSESDSSSCHHVESHDPPKCKCGIVFGSSRFLAIHVRSKLKPFQCTLCEKRFGHLSSLTFHMEGSHQIAQRREAYECGRCVHSFFTLDEIVEHCKKEHPDDKERNESDSIQGT